MRPLACLAYVSCVASSGLVLGVPLPVRAGALDEAGKALRGDSSSGARDSGSTDSSNAGRSAGADRGHHGHHDGDDSAWYVDDEDEGLEILAAYVLFSPWMVPRALLTHLYPDFDGFEAYPYADEEQPLIVRRKVYAAKLGVSYIPAFNNVDSAALFGQVDFVWPLALRGQYRGFLEHSAGPGERNVAGLGEVELLFRFAQSPRLSFHSGLAVESWADAAGFVHGVTVSYGFDAYPVRPMTFGARASVGPMGHSYLFQARAYIGVMLSRSEIQLAYDHIDVAGTQLGGLSLAVQFHL